MGARGRTPYRIAMRIISTFLAAIAILVVSSPVRADEDATYKGPQSAAETSFVTAIQKDLMARFPRASDAIKAGYVRYTNEDSTGAISYANLHWSSDPTHPSQLWYDKDGNLLGADFSVVRRHGEPRPVLWGINPGRWVEFDGHIHYVLRDAATGSLTYDHWIMNPKFAAAGGNVDAPSVATVVQMGNAKNASDVVTIFEFPTIWDLIVWVKPNPNGAFADKNPTVTP